MRVFFIATVLSAFLLAPPLPAQADEGPSDNVRDMVAEAAEKLRNDNLSPEAQRDAINRLRQFLNEDALQRDRPGRDSEVARNQQQRALELAEQSRRAFDEAMRRLESIPRQGFDGPPQGERRGERRGEDIDRRSQQPDRRDAGPRDGRDGRPMKPPRMPERPLGNFPLMQPPRFAIGIAFAPKERDSGEGIVVGRVMERSPAEEAGLRQDDLVIAANDRELREPQQLAEMVQEAGREGREIRLKVRRGDERLDLSLRPRLSPEQDFPPGFGAMPFAMGRPEREIEQLRRQVETMQRQIDVLRDQMNRRGETPEPGKQGGRRQSAEPKPDPVAEDI